MSDFTDELARFARAIVRGEAISPQIDLSYSNYSQDTAIEIYRNNYRGNLHDALAGAYPVIQQLVGEEFFRFMARQYIAQHPSASANLHHYGAQLADFLASFEPVQELVYLPDVATLEWACHVACFAENTGALALDQLARIPVWQHADLILHTACQMVHSSFPVVAIWQAHQPDAACDFQISLDEGGCIALVSRQSDIVRVEELSAASANWLARIQNSEALGVATEATLARYPDFDLQAALLDLAGVLTGFELGTTS